MRGGGADPGDDMELLALLVLPLMLFGGLMVDAATGDDGDEDDPDG
jgi:hypothetical protein